jgi:hypothetical protein
LILFSRLLESYPYSQLRVVAEALLDVCPLLRGEIWAALLGVKVTNSPGPGQQSTHLQLMSWWQM